MAFLIPLLVIIIGATISFGLFFFQANVLQQAVDVGAQEISRMPFSPTAKLGLGDLSADSTTLLWSPDAEGKRFREQIYNPKYLVVYDSEWSGMRFQDYADTWPLINRLLAQVMIRDAAYPNANDPAAAVTRFPGAVVSYVDPDFNSAEETVLIPIIGYGADGTESLVEWVAPVEEIRPGGGEGPFSLAAINTADSFIPGMVALRINYPAQSTTLVNRVGDEGQVVVNADDSALGDGHAGSNYSLVVPAESGDADTAIHSGRFGLGRQAALFRSAGVRPYRKVMSVQAIYRREVFQ